MLTTVKTSVFLSNLKPNRVAHILNIHSEYVNPSVNYSNLDMNNHFDRMEYESIYGKDIPPQQVIQPKPGDAEFIGPLPSEGTGGGKNTVTSNTGNTYDNTPSSNHSTVDKNPGLKGEPNSSVDITNENGDILTRRWYDANGDQVRDLDMTNHGNPARHPEVPHQHGPRGK